MRPLSRSKAGKGLRHHPGWNFLVLVLFDVFGHENFMSVWIGVLSGRKNYLDALKSIFASTEFTHGLLHLVVDAWFFINLLAPRVKILPIQGSVIRSCGQSFLNNLVMLLGKGRSGGCGLTFGDR